MRLGEVDPLLSAQIFQMALGNPKIFGGVL
jgi:hypothetical protein